jgi:hypothetical protein
MWHNPEAWIAIGVSVCFVVVGVVMHRVFVNVLKSDPPEGEKKVKHE